MSGPRLTSTPASPVASLRISKIAAPIVIGVAIRNEKRAAASRFSPAKRAAEMLIPDRLMPGTSASACAAPIVIATGNVTSPTPLVWPPQRSASHRMIAPTTSVTATSPTSRNAVSMRSLSRKPAIAAGIVAATRSHARRRSGSARNERSRMAANPAGTRRSQSARK